MKINFKYILLLAVVVGIWTGCKRDSDYIKVSASAFISNFDLKKIYKETDLTLNADLLSGATFIKGVVISDFRSGNSPAGLLILQNSRITGSGIDSLRGMAFNIGSDAAKYVPGDSVHIKVDGAVLKRTNGILQITNLPNGAVNKVASGRTANTQLITIGAFLASPQRYESTLVTIGSAVVEPEPKANETFGGDKIIDDATGKAIVHTETGASFAGEQLLISGNFSGIPFLQLTGTNRMQIWMRSINDFSFAILPKFSPAIISGYLVDPNSTDGNYEYIQFLATADIDFSKTPYSVITNNNAGASTFPLQGWVTGGARTYKFKLTTGKVSKGEYFYVGGSPKRINGSGSTDISSSKWMASVDYTTVAGADGVGTPTGNLLANTGNIAGIALFEGTAIDLNSVPLDVIFYGGSGGNFYSAGPPAVGYRITNTDFYNTIDPASNGKIRQEFMGAGKNTTRLAFPNAISFVQLGGVYNMKGRWLTKRAMLNISLTATSAISQIEGGTTLSEN
jgi:hypothetical protein